MSRIPRLPEETLHEIISLCITPSNFLKCYGDGIYPDPRNSQLLLVSKQWLRIGVPILYRHLRLTDQEQTKAVGHLLAAHKELGLAIRALRLEGGMGEELHMILSRAPNVEALYVTRQYYLHYGDSVAGLRSSLPSMNIKKLYYERAVRRRKKRATRELEELMTEAIRDHWRELKLVWFIFDFIERIPMETMQSLARLTHLEQVDFNYLDLKYMISAGTLAPLQSAPRLKTVRVHGQYDEADIREALSRHFSPEFAKKFEFVAGRSGHHRWYNCRGGFDGDSDASFPSLNSHSDSSDGDFQYFSMDTD